MSAAALRELERWGFLLLQDARLPSLATLVAGAPIKGSWWGHPSGADIFRAAEALAGRDDVITAKLVCGKVTFVHRRHWPALAAAGRAREPWQLDGLSAQARRLLDEVDARGRLRASGKPAKELESRLLAFGEQVHTESGAHATELESWRAFCRRKQVPAGRRSAAKARAELQEAAARMAQESGARIWMPWE